MRTIPLVDLKAQYRPLKEDILSSIAEIFEGMRLNLGPNVQALESEFADYCGCRHGIGVSDGTTALEIALRACGVGPGDEVITVAHTFFATAEAIALVGAKPVFVDVRPDTLLMDVSQVEAKITARTKAVIAVHLYGQTVDMAPLVEVCRSHGLKVIEDACQAHGARYRGDRAGSLGDVGCFSFYCSKNLGAYGEGGFISTDDDSLADDIRMIRDHGSKHRYHHELVGRNGRLDEVQAAVLRVKLPHLESWNDRRREAARELDRLLAHSEVSVPRTAAGNEPVYHLYVIQAPRRDSLQAWLRDRGIGTGVHYPIPCHLQAPFSELGYRPGSLPVTEAACERILSLPMYPELADDDIAYIASAIGEYYGAA